MNKMRKRAMVAALAAVALLGVAGCAVTTDAKTGTGQVLAKPVGLPGGGEVMCVFWVPVDAMGAASARGAQLDCDWDGVAR